MSFSCICPYFQHSEMLAGYVSSCCFFACYVLLGFIPHSANFKACLHGHLCCEQRVSKSNTLNLPRETGARTLISSTDLADYGLAEPAAHVSHADFPQPPFCSLLYVPHISSLLVMASLPSMTLGAAVAGEKDWLAWASIRVRCPFLWRARPPQSSAPEGPGTCSGQVTATQMKPIHTGPPTALPQSQKSCVSGQKASASPGAILELGHQGRGIPSAAFLTLLLREILNSWTGNF